MDIYFTDTCLIDVEKEFVLTCAQVTWTKCCRHKKQSQAGPKANLKGRDLENGARRATRLLVL